MFARDEYASSLKDVASAAKADASNADDATKAEVGSTKILD